MDFRALAELVMFGLLGTSVLVVAVGFTVRAFVAPTLRDLLGPSRSSAQERHLLAARLGQIEERLDGIEKGVERLEAARDFDRQLGGPKLG